MVDIIPFFEEIAVVIVIVVGVCLILIELQLRGIFKEETAFDKRLRADEMVLYRAEKELFKDIAEMRQALEEWRDVERAKALASGEKT